MKRFACIMFLALGGCAAHKPLMVLPSTEERLAAAQAENASLRQSLADLEKNCTAVLNLYKRAREYEKSPASKEK